MYVHTHAHHYSSSPYHSSPLYALTDPRPHSHTCDLTTLLPPTHSLAHLDPYHSSPLLTFTHSHFRTCDLVDHSPPSLTHLFGPLTHSSLIHLHTQPPTHTLYHTHIHTHTLTRACTHTQTVRRYHIHDTYLCTHTHFLSTHDDTVQKFRTHINFKNQLHSQ